jgi:hypothetical protein
MQEKQSLGKQTVSEKEIMKIVVHYKDGTQVSYSPVQFVEMLAQKWRTINHGRN